MKKKILSLILATTIILSVIMIAPITATAETDGIYNYSVENGEATITGCISSVSGVITIPSTLGGYPVTSIGSYAFSGCAGLTNIEIPNSVTSIGRGAFNDCGNLQYNEYDNALYLGNESNKYLCLIKAKSIDIISCNINENTKCICNYAFECSNLDFMIIPDGVEYIGDYVFIDSYDIEIYLGKNIKYMGLHDNSFLTGNIKKIYYEGSENESRYIHFGIMADVLGYINGYLEAEWEYNCTLESVENQRKIEKRNEKLKANYLKTAIQAKSGAKKTDSSYDLRLISLIDNLKDYKEVGFYITVEGYNDGEGDEPIRYSSDTVYTSFINGTQTVRATDFGANYFNISTLTLPSYCYVSNINIVPFVVFTDGTELKGDGTNTAVKNYIK